ncbi:MAG: tetratricopeptide repeat protein [Deltaproteobacteria bacterium]|nr:tetratricopeptide repeat protein [Deltaproteobacteria bacterium]
MKNLLYISTIIFIMSSCREEDGKKPRFAQKQYYLGHDYFSKYVETLRKIDSLRAENARIVKSLSKLSLSGDRPAQISKIRSDRNRMKRNNLVIERETAASRKYLDAALVELRKAIIADSSHVRAHFELGLIYLKKATTEIDMGTRVQCFQGDEKKESSDRWKDLLIKSRKHFTFSARDKELKSSSYNNISAIDLYLEDWESALEHSKIAMSDLVYQETHVASSNVGWAYFNMKNYPRAISHLKQALISQKNFCLARYRLARIYYKMGRYDDSEREFDRTLKQGPPCNGIQEAWLYGAMSKLKRGDAVVAKDYLRKCSIIAPQSCIAAQCRSLEKNIP